MIEVSGLSKTYRVRRRGSSGLLSALRNFYRHDEVEVAALHQVDWRVERGEVHGLIGRNGSGKSTLIKILCGILHPTSGSARVDNVVPWRERRRYVAEIGVVFGQKSQLTWELPAIDSLALQARLYRVPERRFRSTLSYLVKAFGAIVDRPVRSLSLGERMKCEILCALVHQPKLLFLDEPTIGLDLLSKDQVRHAIRDVSESFGTTVILTSHDVSDVASLCRNISLLDQGRFLYQGDLQRLLEAHSTTKLVRFKFLRSIDDIALAGVPLQRTGELTASLAVDASTLAQLLPQLFQRLPIADISIEATPLEQVVKSLYSRGTTAQLAGAA